ncbi:MAG: glycoside hydrolase family 5 protein [Clostridia bacterium]|nr:glycoside hydrolase family 5 protein [Clostridia bacterium]
MKRIIMIMLVLLAAALCGAASAEEAPADALEMSRRMGNGINLGNTMEACNNGKLGGNTTDNPKFYETFWGQPVTTPEMLRAMKDCGFDTIRIPVAWMTNATHLDKGDFTISEAYMERVEEIVNYALDAGMIVIINDHWDGGWWGMFGSDTEATRNLAMEAYTGMWKQLAERFGKYGWQLVFESANEELGTGFDENSPLYCDDSLAHTMPESERYALANRINQVFVDTVRASGGNNADRFLLIAGYRTDISKTCDMRFEMPKDPAAGRLLVSVHYYSPWSYCGASTAKSATLWGKQADYEAMYADLGRLKRFTAAGYGVVIGEYGALPGSDGVMKKNAPAYHEAFLNCCDALDLGNCLWDCSGFFVRKQLIIVEEEMAAVYAGRNAASESGRDYAEIAAAGKAALDAMTAAAPESLVENALNADADSCVAWIMFSGGDWTMSYSVGDVYTPDSMTPGIVPTDAEITGAGTYTVALDFTGTETGYASNTAFSAIGISNGEQKYPGYCIFFTEVIINGEPVRLKGRNYTCSDDGKCTRSNLYNEWVDIKTARSGARVLVGDLTGISATILDRGLEAMQKIRTIEITFRYEPRK